MTFYTGHAERVRIDTSGDVGIGLSEPKSRLTVYTALPTGGNPAASGSAQDPAVLSRIAGGTVCMDFGVLPAGHQWIQCRGIADYSLKYDLHLQPAGGNVLLTGPGALGYGVGAGGHVEQPTSKSTPVTLNKPCGLIITNNSTLAAGASVNFTVNNTGIIANDVVIAQIRWLNVLGENYRLEVVHVGNGAFTLRLTNISTYSLAENMEISFIVIKGVTS